jgi:hypothetical protein
MSFFSMDSSSRVEQDFYASAIYPAGECLSNPSFRNPHTRLNFCHVEFPIDLASEPMPPALSSNHVHRVHAPQNAQTAAVVYNVIPNAVESEIPPQPEASTSALSPVPDASSWGKRKQNIDYAVDHPRLSPSEYISGSASPSVSTRGYHRVSAPSPPLYACDTCNTMYMTEAAAKRHRCAPGYY